MKDFYDYLSEMEPLRERKAGRITVQKCKKAVLTQMHPRKCRRRFRIALAASAAAITVFSITAVSQMHSDAKRQWRDFYRWMTPKTEAELEGDMQTLERIMITEPQQNAVSGDYRIDLTGYASDGFYGICFFEIQVPESFDWSHPYLAECKPDARIHGTNISVDTNYGYFFGCALTPTGNPQKYRGEARFRFDSGEYLTQEPVDLILPQIVLRDEYYDHDDETGAYTGESNPHILCIGAGIRLTLEQNDYRRETVSEKYGTLRTTPFGVYLFSYDNPEQARNYKELQMQVTLPDGTVYGNGTRSYLEHFKDVWTYDFTPEEIAVMEERGEDLQNLRWLARLKGIFRAPADPYAVTVRLT
ncbi:MAG: hypothetical protein IKI58_12560 [Oscillospiraceae bacterium]|nr:hypothetical protein [Oscillospiraceae bacterium]